MINKKMKVVLILVLIFSLSTFNTNASSYSEYKIQKIDRNIFSIKNFFNNEPKTKKEAGKSEIIFNDKFSSEKTIDNVNLTKSSEISETDSSDITIKNGKIISATNSIFTTKGGIDQVHYMYNSIEEASKKINGVSIDGAAYDGRYYETIDHEGFLYAKVEISGFEGFIALSEIEIVPSSLLLSQSHYAINDQNQWVYYVAVDPIASDEYIEYPFSQIPEWAELGVKYFSDDTENFYTENTNTKRSANVEVYAHKNYFQNLPIRSGSTYSADEYKYFLEKKGKTNSKYFNDTQAFVDTQNTQYFNSLFMFAFANHEGAYGTSNFSNQCNNFFGRGAKDSNPGLACIDFGFPTPRDGILAQAIFLQNEYLDINYWTYNGSYPGTKEGGINVVYASDPNWGIGIASHMDMIDSTFGNKEFNRYQIASVSRGQVAYTNNSLSTPVKNYKNGNNYTFSNNSKGHVNVLVTDASGSTNAVLLDMPKNLGASGVFNRTLAKKGSHPNYNDNGAAYSEYVANGDSSWLVDYSSWSGQQVWVNKASLTMLNSGSIILPQDSLSSNNCPPITPIDDGVVEVYSQNRLKKCSNTYVSGMKVEASTTTYNFLNVETGKVTDFFNQKGRYKSTATSRDNNGILLTDKLVSYYTNGKKEYEITDHYTKGIRIRANAIDWDISGKKTKEMTRYYKNSIEVGRVVDYFSNNIRVKSEAYDFHDDGSKLKLKTINYYNNGSKIDEVIINYSNNLPINGSGFGWYDDGKLHCNISFIFDMNGNLTDKIYDNFDKKGTKINSTILSYNEAGELIKNKSISHYSSGKIAYTIIDNYLAGIKTDSVVNDLNADGTKKTDKFVTYYKTGEKHTEAIVFYTNNIITSEKGFTYNTNFQTTEAYTKHYSSGIQNGLVTDYYNNNNIKISTIAKDILPNGNTSVEKTIHFHANGKKLSQDIVKLENNMKISGTRTTWFNSGQRESIATLYFLNGFNHESVHDFFNAFNQRTNSIVYYYNQDRSLNKISNVGWILDGPQDYRINDYMDENGIKYKSDVQEYAPGSGEVFEQEILFFSPVNNTYVRRQVTTRYNNNITTIYNYDINKNITRGETNYLRSDGSKSGQVIDTYESGIKINSMAYDWDINNIITKEQELQFINGVKRLHITKTYSSGILTNTNTKKYDSSGNLISDENIV